MHSISDLLAGVKFLPTVDTYCDHCARPLCLLAQPGDDLCRLRWLHSQACPCRLKTRALAGLLAGKGWALNLYRLRRRILHRRLGHAAGRLNCLCYPLPESLRRDIATIYASRQAADRPALSPKQEIHLNALGTFFLKERGLSVDMATKTYGSVCGMYGSASPEPEGHSQ